MNKTQFRVWSRSRRVCFRTHSVSYARLQTFAQCTGLTHSAAAHYIMTAALEQIQRLTAREGFSWVTERLPDFDNNALSVEVDFDTLDDIPW